MEDPLIEDLKREQRHRRVIVVAAVIGIVAGVALGMASVLGGIPWAPAGPRNPAVIVFFIGPFALCIGIGYTIYALRR